MKTTIELSDDLLNRVREVARRDGDSLRTMMEEGLRLALASREKRHKAPRFALRTFGGKGTKAGLLPEFEGAAWERLRDAAYEPTR